jgi:hypothetical protein
MLANNWLEIEKRYRMAVHAYCEAVDHLDSAREFGEEWDRVLSARTEADRALSALIRHQRAHLSTQTPRPIMDTSDCVTEEFILGDQGQSGG